MQPYQERVIEERRELCERIEKLEQFIQHNPAFYETEQAEQDRMREQCSVMKQLSRILDRRIKNFDVEAPESTRLKVITNEQYAGVIATDTDQAMEMIKEWCRERLDANFNPPPGDRLELHVLAPDTRPEQNFPDDPGQADPTPEEETTQ